ncbi:benzoylformate decarboxylase [Nonomuraea sp. NPDC050328]|uniref:benzoylformate decarboxylase n=1 Tax=Nonomuraea sp. NPDC050328 TaxID=3364361 RepID=UPI0037B1ADF7
MIVHDAVFDWMRRRELTTLFGNPGSTELPMLDGFPFRYVLGLQEAVVTGMADGYAAVTGRPALVNLHTGPGVGNAMGAILGAAANRTPLIVTAGQQTREMLAIEPLLTNVEATTLPRPAVKWACEPARPQDVPAALERAYLIANTPPRGPVFLSLPMDDFDAPCAGPVALRRVGCSAVPDLGELARRLDAAANPVLVVGAEAGWAAAVELAEHRGLPVWEAPLEGRLGFPHDHPYFQGQLPPAIAPLAAQLAGHDLVLVAGAPVFRYYPHVPGPYLPQGATLVQLTADPDEAARAPVGEAMVCDPGLALAALAKLCAGGTTRPRPRPAPAALPEGGGMSAAAVMDALAQGAPPDTIWFNESPSNRPAFHDRIRPGLPGSFYFAAGGGLGYGLSAAVGAGLAAQSPEPGHRRPIVAVLGDGSAQYAITALWTAAAHQVPVTFVVLSNREYGVLKWFAGGRSVPGLDIPGLDVTTIARGYGVPARRVATPADLADAVRDGCASGAPVLVEAPIL